MKKMNIKTMIKRILSILLGLGITLLFNIILLSYFPNIRRIDRTFVLICIMYVSGILFLILWNKTKSKLVYLLFVVPVACIGIEIGIDKYRAYIRKIPRVYEEFSLHNYEPFREDNILPVLDEASNFKITENLPVLDGATAFYPVYAAFVQAVYPKKRYRHWEAPVLCNRTPNAYNNLLEGKADLIFCLEPSEMQMQQLYSSDNNIKLVPIGKEAFVFFVNSRNQVNNVTLEDIQGIYSGRIKNWIKLNGSYKNIRAYQRPKNSGSQTILEKIMGTVPIIKPPIEDIKAGMETIIGQVAVYKNFNNAIGYSFLQYSTEMLKNDQIKILSINGIYPSIETMQDNSYPFIVNFYAIYNDTENKNENIEPFIEWILSRQGQILVSKTGYIPIIND